jgi:hypothetical protein
MKALQQQKLLQQQQQATAQAAPTSTLIAPPAARVRPVPTSTKSSLQNQVDSYNRLLKMNKMKSSETSNTVDAVTAAGELKKSDTSVASLFPRASPDVTGEAATEAPPQQIEDTAVAAEGADSESRENSENPDQIAPLPGSLEKGKSQDRRRTEWWVEGK